MSEPEKITSRFWNETATDNDPFTTQKYLCAGYDVFGDLLSKASFIDYLFLLFKHKQPSKEESCLLNALAIALANPGPRNHSVQAAMSGAAGGSVSAACLMSAIAVGAGNFGGAREVFHLMNHWEKFGTDTKKWEKHILSEKERINSYEDISFDTNSPEFNTVLSASEDVWLPMEHVAGFSPYLSERSKFLDQLFDHTLAIKKFSCLTWLSNNRDFLESLSNNPLNITFVASAALADLGFDSEESEMIFILLRLPGAAAHTIEQKRIGWKNFPFYDDKFNVLDI